VVDVHDEVVRHAGLIIPLRRIANRISVRYSLRSTPFVLPIRNVPAETFTLVLATTCAALPCQLFSFRCPCRHEIRNIQSPGCVKHRHKRNRPHCRPPEHVTLQPGLLLPIPY